MYQRVKDGIFFHESKGRLVEHKGYSTKLYWSKDMLDFLRQNFATMLNEELAGCLGVSQRSVTRKARELGLQKDAVWLQCIHRERLQLANHVTRTQGNIGQFQKGQHPSPSTEFKAGQKPSKELRQKQIAGYVKWCRQNPTKLRERAYKSWETRRKNQSKDAA